MATLVSLEQVRGRREYLGAPGREVWRTFFLQPPPGSREPQGFLIEYGPGVVLETHFHDVDEFQVVVAGSGTLGRHPLVPYTVHHAHAWTPYGPIVAGTSGLSFLTLRARCDSAGPRRLPQQLDVLEAAPGRRPWQAAEAVTLPPTNGPAGVVPFRRIVDARGALGDLVLLPPDAVHEVGGDDASGAFVALLRGSLRAPTGLCPAPAIAFVPAGGERLRLVSGPEGAAALVLRFTPEAGDAAREPAPTTPVWQCSLCGSIYDERTGDPSAGVAPGTPWHALPEDWRCADCDAPRAKFVRRALDPR